MKLKLSITDKFLWEVYHFYQATGNVAKFALPSRKMMHQIAYGTKNPIIEKYQEEMGRRRFGILINYLKRNNYIEASSLKSSAGIILAKEGISKALKVGFNSVERKKRKDGRWIMIIFDIPKKYNKSRHLLRSVLQNMGYKLLQQSVWVTPYDVQKETERLLQFYSLEEFVKILLIQEIKEK